MSILAWHVAITCQPGSFGRPTISLREKAIDPLYVLTNQLPELAGDPDDERSSPYPD
jgi:hypothetical protein